MVLAAVAFDLDGTLFDHRSSARNGLVDWLSDLGVAWDEDFATAWATAEDRHFAAWREGHVSFAEQRRRRLRDVLPLIGHPVGDDEQLDAVFAGYLSRIRTLTARTSRSRRVRFWGVPQTLVQMRRFLACSVVQRAERRSGPQ